MAMLELRRSEDRGYFDFGWQKTHHTFSFGDYYDQQHMGFRSLRVINEDHVAPGAGFPMHGHRDMEIITYIVSGALEHKDSMGSASVIQRGRVQHMSAGNGVMHSEFNPSPAEPVHLLQIWIKPRELHITPAYHEHDFSEEERSGTLLLVAAPAGEGMVLPVQQDIRLYTALLAPGQAVQHPLAAGRHAWVQLVRGELLAMAGGNEDRLTAGDGAACSNAAELSLTASTEAELLLFDLA
jgi:quercetin 2,3-dioxygenase